MPSSPRLRELCVRIIGVKNRMVRAARDSLVNFIALIIASILFAASFPNLVFQNGLPLLAWIAYIPVFWVIRRSSFGLCFFWGAFYGYAAYGLFNYWLSVFHPLAGLIVGSIYLVYLALLFPILRLAVVAFPRRGYIVQWLCWMAFEYLRCQGFLAYSYGVTGYSQWNLLPVIQIADIAGVWGVSALVVFPSAALAAVLSEAGLGRTNSLMGDMRGISHGVISFFRREWLPALVWLVLLVASLVYGFVSPIDYSGKRQVKVALIQYNTDPWIPSRAPTATQELNEYRNDFKILCRLSDEALALHPDTDLVVWSETAFVPRIYWHMTIRDDPNSWALVRELLDYLEKKSVPFVIGNDDARRDPSINPKWDHRVDYNAAMLFEGSSIKTIYRKLHLVPFTENFPYEKQLPWIYNALINADTHFWEKGKEATVFEASGVKFSTPICFEDTFGYLSRDFVLNGAELIVNMSNDAWSASVPAQMQHLSMAIFRAVENRRSMVRSTASGQTCAIDPNGRILAMAEPFTETYISAEVPIVTPLTLYTRFGDYLGLAFTLAALLVLIVGIILYIIRKEGVP
jgi:apolipoprotein N-acyltransferase